MIVSLEKQERYASQYMVQCKKPLVINNSTPTAHLSRLEQSFPGLSWQSARDSLHRDEGGGVCILVRNEGWIPRERSMRPRHLHELQHQNNSRDQLQRKPGAAQKEAGRAWHPVEVQVDPG